MTNRTSRFQQLRSYTGLAALGWIVFAIGVATVGVAMHAGVSRGVSWCMVGGFTTVCLVLWSRASRVDRVQHHPDPFRAGLDAYRFDRAGLVID